MAPSPTSPKQSSYCHFLTQGNYAPICVTVTYTPSTGPDQFVDFYFKSYIDTFSTLTLSGIASKLSGATAASAIIYYQGVASPSFTLVNSTGAIQRHFFSIVINQENGVVPTTNPIVGDNFCDGSCVCYNNECFESNSKGYGTIDCTIYVSWAGTDTSGTHLLSNTMRLSRYSFYSMSSVYSAVKSNLGY